MTKLTESQIQRGILDYLAARRIMAFRMNSGAMVSEYKGRKRFMRFGVPGMADVLAFPIRRKGWLDSPSGPDYKHDCVIPLWIECKAPNGKQSELQKSFQAQVEAEGHRYIVARSIEDVEAAL